MSDLSEKPCPECGGRAIEWLSMSNPKVRHGWHCVACGYYDQATGRERLLDDQKKSN